MKQVKSIYAILICTLLVSTGAQATNIDFRITGLKSNEGKVYIQLFKGENNYKNGTADASSVVKANKGEVLISFSAHEHGEYGIRYFHDENDNGKLETNLFGLPVEGYGYSNSAKPNFGPVAYEQIKFKVTSEHTANSSQVIY